MWHSWVYLMPIKLLAGLASADTVPYVYECSTPKNQAYVVASIETRLLNKLIKKSWTYFVKLETQLTEVE